jgi:hypothetical protein
MIDFPRRGVISGQGMPVRHEKETIELRLKLYPVIEGTMEIPQVKPPRGPHAAKNPFPFGHFGHYMNSFFTDKL